MKPRLFGVDGNWVVHRVFHTLKYEVADKGAAMAYRFLSRVCQDAIAVRANAILVAFDGDDIFRYKIYPEYKIKRGGQSNDKEVYDHLPDIKKLLAVANIPVVHSKKFEADDVLRSVAHRYSPEYDVVIGARDKDSYQYLKPGVRLYDSAFRVDGELAPRYVCHTDVPALMGVAHTCAMEYQVLCGDHIDDVPQILTPAKAKKGLNKWGSIAEWCRNDEEMADFFRANKAQFVLNKKLVQLRTDALPDDLDVRFVRSKSTTLTKNYYAFADMAQPRSRGLF